MSRLREREPVVESFSRHGVEDSFARCTPILNLGFNAIKDKFSKFKANVEKQPADLHWS